MDARHQRDGRKVQGTGEHIYGKWQFFKMNLMTGKTETIKLAKAGLEINTEIFMQGIIANTRQSEKRYEYFTTNNFKDVDWFNAMEELKKGSRIYTNKAVYWAVHTAPRKFNPDLLHIAKCQLIAFAVVMNGETDGIRWIHAAEKAFDVAINNDTVEFDGELLTFRSLTSGKTRMITKFGCFDSCDCGNQPSYHRALFELFKRYAALGNNVRCFRRAA